MGLPVHPPSAPSAGTSEPFAHPATGAPTTHLVGGVDVNLTFVGGGVRNCTTAQQIAGANTGPGWLTISNLDASATIYFGLTGVTGASNGYPIAPGQVAVTHYAAVETIYVIGSSTVGWKVER